jgi:hypothetical protein
MELLVVRLLGHANPARHGWHVACPPSLNVPGGHGTGKDALTGQDMPAQHTSRPPHVAIVLQSTTVGNSVTAAQHAMAQTALALYHRRISVERRASESLIDSALQQRFNSSIPAGRSLNNAASTHNVHDCSQSHATTWGAARARAYARNALGMVPSSKLWSNEILSHDARSTSSFRLKHSPKHPHLPSLRTLVQRPGLRASRGCSPSAGWS